METSALEQIYLQYREELEKCARKLKPTDGLFGLGHGLKDDACHERFDEQLEQAIGEMAASGPASEEAEAAARLIFTQSSLYAYPESAKWMLYATERHILLLVPHLTPEAAARLCGEYGKRYSRWNRLPMQKKVYASLKERGKEA